MPKPLASISIDLDNKWAYLRTHGCSSWEQYPSYLDVAVPRILECCAERKLRLTCFVVGRDAQRRENREPLAELAYVGHEIGNHSLNHYPWMHTLSRDEVEMEICLAHDAIVNATGRAPVGFRGPGFSVSDDVVEILASRGYEYDASTLPTYIGPVARWYFRRMASAEAAERASERQMFGAWSDGLRANRPYLWSTAGGSIVEIPVTTFPLLRLPIHMTYLLYLWRASQSAARLYLAAALRTCRLLGVSPSILLHPLDFLGEEDDAELRFFPGMNLPREEKMALLDEMLARLAADFQIVPLSDVANVVKYPSKTEIAAIKSAATLPQPFVAVSEAG